ncbi:hypothetical protein F5B20DRAFT_66553 [Whalleya microplaca]|nr:hypothetical protein F5B20DRAFT_66553 [Whalleya microplaca]
MIGTSVWDYVFIRTCIFFLHLVAPLSVLYLVTSLFIPLPFGIPRVLEVWIALEAAFYLVVYLPRKAYLQRATTHPVPPCREDRRKLFRRCHSTIPDLDRYLTKWFQDAPAAEIKRENIKDFFRWAFLNTGELDSGHEEELDEYVGELEKMLGRELEPGRGNAKCLRLTLDEVDMLHRSLTWYLCVFIVDTVASGYLRYYSFDFHRTPLARSHSVFPLRPFNLFTTHLSPAKTLTYWHRPHTSKTRIPILFIHGIGIGLYPYVNFLSELNAQISEDSPDGQVGIIAVEIMSVSFRITSESMLKGEMCEEIDSILKAHGWDKFVLVSHSYGSIIATHLLHTSHIAEKIGPILFIDPVSFLLHLPDVAYNFMCRKPTRANEHQLSYFASKDMGVSHTLSRRFFWADNIMWKEDLKNHHVTVSLAGRDLIVDAKVIAAYLIGEENWTPEAGGSDYGVWKGDTLGVLWFQQLDHAQVFDKKRTRAKLVSVVQKYCARDYKTGT